MNIANTYCSTLTSSKIINAFMIIDITQSAKIVNSFGKYPLDLLHQKHVFSIQLLI